MNTQRLVEAIQAYTATVKNYLQTRLGVSLVNETLTLPAEDSQEYDLTTLLGEDHDTYDKLSAAVTVLVMDDTDGSPTQGFYINSEAVVTVARSPAGVVRLYNYQTTDVDCHVRIDVPIKTTGDV